MRKGRATMKMANEYDDMCTALEVIIGVLYLQKFYTVFVWCLRNLAGTASAVKLAGMKEVVQHNKTLKASLHVSFRIKSSTTTSLHCLLKLISLNNKFYAPWASKWTLLMCINIHTHIYIYSKQQNFCTIIRTHQATFKEPWQLRWKCDLCESERWECMCGKEWNVKISNCCMT